MTEEWFRWERESSIQSMFPCLKAWNKPFRDYVGFGWPTSILIYLKNVVAWCLRRDDVYKFGQKLIDYYLVQYNLSKLKTDIEVESGRLNAIFNDIDSTRLPDLDNDKVLALYNSLVNEYIEWYKIGGSIEPIDMQAEKVLAETLVHMGKDTKLLSSLIVISNESFAMEQQKDLLRIAAKIKSTEGGEYIFSRSTEKIVEEMSDELKDFIDAHTKKYFWVKNNFLSTSMLDHKFFVGELKKIMAEVKDPASYISGLETKYQKSLKVKKNLIRNMRLPDKDKKLIDLLDFFGWFQDYRKKYVLMTLHYLDVLLAEISERSGVSLDELKFTFPGEMELILKGGFSRNEISKRMRNCMIIWRENSDNYEYYSGEGAFKKEKEIFSKDDKLPEVMEINGSPAQRGIVRGVAFVTSSAIDAGNMKRGQILVAPMTSPDFVTVMKKAAAIVTDWGGLLCHAAIVSREFGIPCVVGTNIATKVIKTGDMIEVDADEGVVRKIIG
ncbi:MAG: PEP-utilizing enzyme [Candidatus Aenigmatarchaeota archaeon]